MIAIVIVTLIILVLILSERLWYTRTPTWVDDILSVVVLASVIVDGVLIGIKVAKVVGLL